MDIFIIKTSAADSASSELLEQFSHKNFLNEKKKKEHCFSYFMLDRVLKEVYNIKNRELEFVNKKPYLKTREKFFSLSHSGEYIVIALSDFECGIDIEQIKPRNFKAIAVRMGFNSKSLEEFYSDWTKYEAEYKLGKKTESILQTNYQNYSITAVSSNVQEMFEIFIQNGEHFSNLKTLS